MKLDQTCFTEHILHPDFTDGVERGYWAILPNENTQWPYVLIWLAAPSRPNGPERFILRFSLNEYPSTGPTATLWDPDKNAKLEDAKWPKGTGNVAAVFNRGDFLYAPWDSKALGGHQDWPKKYTHHVWKPMHTIVHYLKDTRNVLDSPEYNG